MDEFKLQIIFNPDNIIYIISIIFPDNEDRNVAKNIISRKKNRG